MDALELLLDRYLASIEGEMRAVVEAHDPGQGDLFGMLRYHLGWVDVSLQPCDAATGKRIRPVLCLMACEGCGEAWEHALPAAAAVELLHNFTLIHDDIEDGDERRRGRPTVWSVWGEAQGINAGDTLFCVSQLALLRLRWWGVPDATVLCAMRLFNKTCVAVTAGQCLDIGFESRDDVSVKDYLTMIEGKTAALVSCACDLGALVAGASEAQRKALRAFGRHSGLAFQMLDDVLGIWGDSTLTGKPVGVDIARRKKTLPLLHGLKRSAELRSLLGGEALSRSDVRRATDLLEREGSRAFTEGLAHQHHEKALDALGRADLRRPIAEGMRRVADQLLVRES